MPCLIDLSPAVSEPYGRYGFENFDTARTDGRIGYLTGSTLYNDNDNDNDEFNKRRTNAIKKL